LVEFVLLSRGRLQYIREVQSAEEFLRALDPVARGRLISVLRSARGLTRDELAREARVSPNTVSDWEKGKVKSPRDLFAKLAPVLDLSLTNLRHALTLVRAQRRPDEIAEAAPAPYDATAADDDGPLSLLDSRTMSSPDIERELSEIATRLGRSFVRCMVLSAELAVRGTLRSS
jgi:transcriptional regulator with XRE-family HTH domain